MPAVNTSTAISVAVLRHEIAVRQGWSASDGSAEQAVGRSLRRLRFCQAIVCLAWSLPFVTMPVMIVVPNRPVTGRRAGDRSARR